MQCISAWPCHNILVVKANKLRMKKHIMTRPRPVDKFDILSMADMVALCMIVKFKYCAENISCHRGLKPLFEFFLIEMQCNELQKNLAAGSARYYFYHSILPGNRLLLCNDMAIHT